MFEKQLKSAKNINKREQVTSFTFYANCIIMLGVIIYLSVPIISKTHGRTISSKF